MEKIHGMAPIAQPEDKFHTYLNLEDENKLRELTQTIRTQVTNFMDADDFASAATSLRNLGRQ